MWHLSLGGISVAKSKALTVSQEGGWVSWPWGFPQHGDLKPCSVTYVVDSEVSTGPVVLFFLRHHLHRDVTISYGLFCEWPVMVTFHLKGQQHNLLRPRGWGRNSQWSFRESKWLASEELYRITVRIKNEARGTYTYVTFSPFFPSKGPS